MAWTAPRTWVDGEVVTASIMNSALRDDLLALSVHAHDGTAGEGDDELSGVDSVNFDEIGTPSAPGASKLIFYTKTSSGKLYYRAGAAGAETEISDSIHTHSLTEFDQGSGQRVGAVANPTLGSDIAGSGGTATASDTLSTLTEKTLVCAVGVFALEGGAGSDWDIELTIGGVVVGSLNNITSEVVVVLTGSREESSGTPAVQGKATNQAPAVGLRPIGVG